MRAVATNQDYWKHTLEKTNRSEVSSASCTLLTHFFIGWMMYAAAVIHSREWFRDGKLSWLLEADSWYNQLRPWKCKRKNRSASRPLDSPSVLPVNITVTSLFNIFTHKYLQHHVFVIFVFSVLLLSTLEYKMKFRFSSTTQSFHSHDKQQKRQNQRQNSVFVLASRFILCHMHSHWGTLIAFC